MLIQHSKGCSTPSDYHQSGTDTLNPGPSIRDLTEQDLRAAAKAPSEFDHLNPEVEGLGDEKRSAALEDLEWCIKEWQIGNKTDLDDATMPTIRTALRQPSGNQDELVRLADRLAEITLNPTGGFDQARKAAKEYQSARQRSKEGGQK